MGRLPQNVEFLRQLMNILGIRDRSEFSRMCGKPKSNMSNYLNAVSPPSDLMLEDCLLNATVSRIFDKPLDEETSLGETAKDLRDRVLSVLFKQSIEAHGKEIEYISNKTDLPEFGGVYILYDSSGHVLYIGKAKNLKTEVRQTLGREISTEKRLGSGMKKVKPSIGQMATHMSLYKIENETLRHDVEAFLLRIFINHMHNRNIGHIKVGESG